MLIMMKYFTLTYVLLSSIFLLLGSSRAALHELNTSPYSSSTKRWCSHSLHSLPKTSILSLYGLSSWKAHVPVTSIELLQTGCDGSVQCVFLLQQ